MHFTLICLESTENTWATLTKQAKISDMTYLHHLLKLNLKCFDKKTSILFSSNTNNTLIFWNLWRNEKDIPRY